MRRVFVVVVLFVAMGSAAVAAGAPTLRVVSIQPYQVRGIRFKPAERVTVRLAVEGRSLMQVVRAASSGTFTAAFKTVSVDHCTRWVVVAQGNRGSRATLRPSPFVDCPQP